ncbi:MAG TPA: AzlC family ABC transporter permease [Nocardioidaceae bacterium]|nr:AzlC family ABC transporter permease [Nocardioidaceae bacterium]
MSRTDAVATRDVVTSGGELAAGMRAMAPMIVAYAPFGLLVGAAVAASDSPMAAWLSTWTIYGGAAHLAVLDVLQRDAGVVGAVLVGLLINARMIAYSVSLAPHWRDATTRSRVAAAAMLTDATWAMAHNTPAETPRARRHFYFGAGLMLWFGWPLLVSLGVVVGGWVHGAPVATLLPSLTLGTLAIRQLQNRPGLAAGVAATAVAVATIHLDSGLALGLAACAGAGAAVLVNRRTA